MNKNFKIFQLNGLSGLLILGFILTGVFFGFVVFPIWAVMLGWNSFVGEMLGGPVINYIQASLLWLAFILVFYLMFRNNILIKIQKEDISDYKDINEIINEIKTKDINNSPKNTDVKELQENEHVKK